MNHRTLLSFATFALVSLGNIAAQDLGGDMTLKRLLLPGQDWQVVAESLAFADAPMSDHEGNFYYCDMRGDAVGIYRVAPNGSKTKLSDESVSGMKFGPDGKLYACQGAKNRMISIDLKTKEVKTLTEDVKPNDLVVTHKGYIYFTETGKKQVTFLNPKTGDKKAADVGITAPNGIALSQDQSTLAVSDVRGVNVWTFRIDADGTLSAKAPYMTMRTEVDPTQKGDGKLPVYKTASGGDGMSTDIQGRYYVATAMGVQVFDPTGRECGLLSKPHNKGMTSVNVGGPNGEYLYATLGDKIFRRKIQANGFYPYKGPVEPQVAK